MNDLLNTLTDKLAIIELLNRFGIAIDERDWGSFSNLFADLVEFDYSAIGDIAGSFSSEEITNNAYKNFSGFEATQHIISNHQVEIQDNTASCKAYVRAMHVLPNEDTDSILEIGGSYTGQLIRTDSDWKIIGWEFTIFWSKGNLKLFELAKEQN